MISFQSFRTNFDFSQISICFLGGEENHNYELIQRAIKECEEYYISTSYESSSVHHNINITFKEYNRKDIQKIFTTTNKIDRKNCKDICVSVIGYYNGLSQDHYNSFLESIEESRLPLYRVPTDLKNEFIESSRFILNIEENNEEIKQKFLDRFQNILLLLTYCGDDDILLHDLGIVVSGYFFSLDCTQIDIDLGIGDIYNEIHDLFLLELDVPPQHTSYGSYDQPRKLVKEKLQQAINLLQ